MKSVINAAARRNMDQIKDQMGQEALGLAAQSLRLRSESEVAAMQAGSVPRVSHDAPVPSGTGQPLANYLAAKRVGNLLYLSGVIAVNPATQSVISRYEDLPAHARQSLRGLGYDTGQLSVDIFEAPIVAQSWFVLERIRQIAAEYGAEMSDAFKLVQYFRDLRHYPAYNRVRNLFCPEGVVSTVVEVSRMLPSDEVLVEVEATVQLKSV